MADDDDFSHIKHEFPLELMIPAKRARALAVLRRAADLLREPGRWTTKLHARTVDGTACSPYHPEAVCFCTMGAVMFSFKHLWPPILSPRMMPGMTPDSIEALLDFVSGCRITKLNDRPGMTAEHMAQELDKAVQFLEEME